MSRLWLIAVLSFAAACGGSGGTASPTTGVSRPGETATVATTASTAKKKAAPMTLEEAVATLKSAGLGCADVVDKPVDAMVAGPKPVKQGECTVGGKSTAISVYAKAADAEASFAVGQALACSFDAAKAESGAVAVGRVFLIGIDDGDVGLTGRLADVLGLAVRRFKCS